MKKLHLLTLITGLFFITAATAETYVPGCGNDPTPPPCVDVPGPQIDNKTVGPDSVSPYRANKSRHVTDLETSGLAPIAFTRIYNSRTTDYTTNYVEFGWKQTWQHNWSHEMRDLSSSTFGFNDIKVRYPSGVEYNFKATDTNGLIRAPYAFVGDRLYKWTGGTVGFTLVTPGGKEYDFQRSTYPRYRLVRMRDGQGTEWSMGYDGYDRLSKVENEFGRWIEIHRGIINGRLCITGLESGDGREVTYGYDTWESMPGSTSSVSDLVLSEVHYPDGSQAEYTYVGAESLTTGRPLLATASDPCVSGAGARAKLVYNYDFVLDFGSGPYLVTGVVLEQRNLDTDEALVRMPEGSGEYPQVLLGDDTEETYKYTNGLIQEWSDGEGRAQYYTRDQGGAGYVSSIADSESNTTTYVRDYAGRILEQVDPLGNTNRFTYNDEGFPLTQTDPLGRTTTFTRDTNNLPVRIDYPDGSYEEWSYNEFLLPLTNRLRNGGTATFAYYGTNETGGTLGELKSTTDPMGNATTYTWTPAGHRASVTDARSNISYFASDWKGRPLAITNADGTSVSFRYDAFGNCTNQVDELGRATAYTYDSYNRVQTVRDPLGRVVEYEYGRTPGCGGCGVYDATITRITDPAGIVTEYAYDRSGKRTNETVAVGTPEEATTSWTYDSEGRLKTQTDANGNLHTWIYDAAGRMVAESNAASEVTAYAYDAAGNLTNRVDGAGVSSFREYDSMGRLVVQGSGNLRYEYAYDLGGRCTSTCTRVDGTITESTAYAYDFNNRLVSKTAASNTVLTYGYDALGGRTNFAVAGVLDVSYEYDARNRLVEIHGNGETTQFGYDAAGQRTNAIWPNGTHAAYAYDDAGQLLSLVHGRAGSPNPPIASFIYGYNLSGNRTNMVTLEGTNSYAYDARGQLTAVTYPDGSSEAFAYDPVGNRTSLVQTAAGGPAIDTAYAYGPANRLLSSALAAETNVYTFDDAGRLVGQTVNGQARTYGYDFQSRMTSLTDTNGSVFRYAFDGEGNRIRQSLNDCLATRFVYDGANVVAEMNASNEVVWAYVNGAGIDQPIERIAFINGTARNRQVYHADGLGSVSVLTDEGGEPVQTYAYAAFGGVRAQTGTDLNRVTFTAREALGDSLGFFYYRNRVYEPNTGRFISEDPLGFVDGANRYVYLRSNPVNFVDPLGMLSDGLASAVLGTYMDNNPDFGSAICASWNGTGNEVGFFFVTDPNDGITIQPWPDNPNNTHHNVEGPPEAPANAVATGHTHEDPNGMGNGPSPIDYNQENYGLPDFVFDPNRVWPYWPKKQKPKDSTPHGIPCD